MMKNIERISSCAVNRRFTLKRRSVLVGVLKVCAHYPSVQAPQGSFDEIPIHRFVMTCLFVGVDGVARFGDTEANDGCLA